MTGPRGDAPESAALTCVAVYERRVGASLERVWENVLDWEHLPWLHRSAFRSIAREDSGEWGWRARVGLQPAGEILLELVVEREALRYVARTLEGPGRGAEIWTRLEPVSAEETGIAVEFHLPGGPPERVAAVGERHTALYTRLWDEDEGMMRRRTSELARLGTRVGADSEPLALGPVEALRPRLPLRVEIGGRGYRVVELDGKLVAHSTVCPHALGPLDDVPVEEGCVRCPWHGYVFDVRSGLRRDGDALRLSPAPSVRIAASGEVFLTPPSPR